MEQTITDFITRKSIDKKFPFKRGEDFEHDLYNALANNYQGYIIESPMMPLSFFEDEIFTIYFPTPYFKATNDENEKVINHTRQLISEGMNRNPREVIIDLRGNLGGDFSVFYGALYALLPPIDKIISGVDKEGNEIATIEDKDGMLLIKFENKVVYKKNIKPIPKYDVPTKVNVNTKSMSSSQLIAIIALQKWGEDSVIGEAPENYTNGSSAHSKYSDAVVIPHYMFRDSRGVTHRNGLQRMTGGFDDFTNIVSEFEKSPFVNGSIDIDVKNVVSVNHLRAIIHNEYYLNNNHSRIEYLTPPKPEWKLINDKLWVFLPTRFKYGYEDPKQHPDHRAEIKADYEEIYRKLDEYADVVIDIRSFETRGKDLLRIFAPFLTEKKITKEIEGESYDFYIGCKKPFLSNVAVTGSGFMKDRNVVFIVDKNTAKLRDLSFSMLMNNLCENPNYLVYGDIGDVNEVYMQETVSIPKKYLVRDKECTVRLSRFKIDYQVRKVIPPEYRPYSKSTS